MILMRHGETLFNVVFGAMRIDPGLRDPELTPRGREQAGEAAEMLRSEDVRRVITSPYRRALQTAEIIADALKLPVTVEPLIRERAAFACDVGSPPAELARLWRTLAFDHLAESWWSECVESHAALDERCRAFCRAMTDLPDWPHVAVITHWGVIRSLTGRPAKNAERIRIDPRSVIGQEPVVL
jgi:broad specificity phosphatase PhoE